MIRRSFRLGLTLGLLAGLAIALAKMLGGRTDSSPAPASVPAAPWPRLDTSPPSPAASWTPSEAGAPPSGPVPAPAGPTQSQAPATPAVERDAPEPTEEPAPAAEVRPATAAPAATPAKKAKKAPLKAGPAAATSSAAAEAAAPRAATPKKAAPKKEAAKMAPVAAWVVPEGDVCPTGHPVKARLASGIFHVPGMLDYLRTHPDRCYRDAASAEADGLRAAKR